MVITCPGLDPSFRSTELRGDALLEPADGEVVDPAAAPGPDEGESFG